MQIVIRNYTGKGAMELFDLLEKRSAELQPVMRSIKGFVSYTLARTPAGGVSVTICQDQAGIDQSIQKAKDWVAANAGKIAPAAPAVSVGNVIAHWSAA